MIALIAYRNPFEEWWWESGCAAWLTLIMVGGIALYVVGLAIRAAWQRYLRSCDWRTRPKKPL